MKPKPVYKPISAAEFRVVHLLPGAFNDELRCVLETRSTTIKTRYEALSYEWGIESNPKPIRIAQLASPSPQSQTRSPDPVAAPTRWPLFSHSRDIFCKFQLQAERYAFLVKILSWVLGTTIIWHYISPLQFEPADWIARLGVPAKPYIFFLCMICGAAPGEFLVRIIRLVVEIVRTKPWSLALHPVRFKGIEKETVNLEWRQMDVTANLELALRYLRLEMEPRTIWVDALCINQRDEGEKQMQVQRMDSVYANASIVVVWLGGYHSSHVDAKDCREGDDCEHRRQIQTAFGLFWRLSGSRVLIPFIVARHKPERIRRATPGLQDLYCRGWWERLWVIQEVALATGPVRLQCGQCTINFDDFQSAQYPILDELRKVKKFKDSASPVERLRTVVKDFKHSEFNDREENPVGMLIARGLFKAISVILRADTEEKEVSFHKQPFAARLQRILLRTAGHFRCRDDRDRLFAVLGIAGGVKLGNVKQLSDLVRYVSAFSTGQVIGHAMDPLFKAYPNSWKLKLAGYATGFLHAAWAWYYDSIAKFWTINKPEYVVTGYKEVVDAVLGGSGVNSATSRVAFFTALARHLGNETSSLAFLDAACCGTDKDEGMPSWVPNWTREVGKDAYKFAMRKKDNLAKDLFVFDEDDRTLWVVGQPKGKVDVVRSMEDDTVVLPFEMLESWLALPPSGKEAMKAAFGLFGQATTDALDPELADGAKTLMPLSMKLTGLLMKVGSTLLEMNGGTLVYGLGNLDGDMGFLKAGEAAEGDQIVFVPGCFHHLVLRKHGPNASGGMRWRLVGLVVMGTDKSLQGGCPQEKWARLRKEKAVFKYGIV